MRLLLVDDEPPAMAKLARFLAAVDDVEIAGSAHDGPAALALAASTPADAMLLDIEMPGCSGLEVAARLPAGMLAVFTTAHDAFAARAFDLHAVDYLLKPFTRERLLACLDRLRQRLAYKQRQGLVGALHQAQPITGHWLVAQGGALHRVSLAEVEQVEAADNYIELRTSSRTWLDRITLAAFLAHPAAGGFVRVHRRFAVNLAHVVRITPLGKGDAELTLTSGRTVRVSRRHRDALVARSPQG